MIPCCEFNSLLLRLVEDLDLLLRCTELEVSDSRVLKRALSSVSQIIARSAILASKNRGSGAAAPAGAGAEPQFGKENGW